jgi:hypothetical protein
MLAEQAVTLEIIFSETARRMAANMGNGFRTVETYSRIALKTRANSRATQEALAKMHQPREQTVRQVHVNEGGQAVIADQFHHHRHGTTGGQKNDERTEQAYDQRDGRPALRGQDPQRYGLPITGAEWEKALPVTRRIVAGGA